MTVTPAERQRASRKRMRSKDLQRVELKLPAAVVATLDRIGSDRSATVAKLIQGAQQ